MNNLKKIEQKWQQRWIEKGSFKALNGSDKEKYYILVEFPYPSGNGLHVGHVRSYSALDAMARVKRRQGFNVLFPMGMDAFGSPAEQYAIKHKINPKAAVEANIKIFSEQMQNLGFSFDWDRFVNTSDPNYYKWTQWQFLKFYEAGMAYKAEKEINWCPTCKTGLSNEDAAGGVCERCGAKTVKKLKNQWLLKMQSYADKLLDGLADTDFLEKIKTAQVNWIGKSEGAFVDFKIKEIPEVMRVFTTRPDTLYGATFMVMAPEHELLTKYQTKINNLAEVRAYQKAAASKDEIERTDMTKDKTGVKIEGLTAINPINNKEIPIYISDYVLASYGTGAIMAVPAHDERDYEFAQKFNIEIIPVIEAKVEGQDVPLPYIGEGKMINSGILNGLTNKAASINKMIDYLEEQKIGSRTTNYRLQDWIFSRQRFWGEPIPMIYCEKCGWVP
ncbi:MAG TPA: leucine--tRNA ligase, partial [Bacilli bacterium]|nr:leucine--tRNA ligase [Bacilli bacterium]